MEFLLSGTNELILQGHRIQQLCRTGLQLQHIKRNTSHNVTETYRVPLSVGVYTADEFFV